MIKAFVFVFKIVVTLLLSIGIGISYARGDFEEMSVGAFLFYFCVLFSIWL